MKIANNNLHEHWKQMLNKLKLGDKLTLKQNGDSPQEWGELEFVSLTITSDNPFQALLKATQVRVVINEQNPWIIKIHRPTRHN